MVEGSPNLFFKKEKRTETEINNLSPIYPTDFLEISTAMQAKEKEEFSIEKNSSKKHTVAIWTFKFHKISGFERVILKVNFNPIYWQKYHFFYLKIQIY